MGHYFLDTQYLANLTKGQGTQLRKRNRIKDQNQNEGTRVETYTETRTTYIGQRFDDKGFLLETEQNYGF